MPLLFFAGFLLLFLGLFSGLALVLSPLGVISAEPGLTLWLTFPVLTLAGFAMCAMQAHPTRIRTVSITASAILLLLSVGSLAVLVLGSAGVVPAPADSAPLWFVVVVGAVLGAVGGASFGRTVPASSNG
jgi:hypothetical protein